MSAKEKIGRWLNRTKDALGLWALLPPSLVAIVSAYLANGVSWINQYGAWGWFMSGLAAFLTSSVAFALIARTKIWRVEARSRARTIGDSSPFDPMARVYENKRLYLRDLAPLGRRQVIGKTFINCEIIGPGAVVLGLRVSDKNPPPLMKNSGTFDVDCIEIDPSVRSQLAVEFYDCDFDGCKFYHMSLLFTERQNDTLHWITKDARQAVLPDVGGALTAYAMAKEETGDGKVG